MADDIHLSMGSATFGGEAITDCDRVKLRLYQNCRYHEHFHGGHRFPVMVFEWQAYHAPVFGDGLWEKHGDWNGKTGTLSVVDAEGVRLEVEARCKMWNNGADPTLEFTFAYDPYLRSG